MIHILVRLIVKDFDALEKFEQKAAAIMKDYRGKIISALANFEAWFTLLVQDSHTKLARLGLKWSSL